MAEGDSVTGNRTVREMENRVRELERRLGRKAMDVEVLKEALKRDGVRANPLPDGETVPSLIGDWIEDHNENHT